MTDAEFRDVMERLGITPTAFASLVGAAPRVAQRWASGSATIPPGIAALARVAVAVAGRMDYAALEALLREEADRLAGDPVAVRSR